MDQLIEEIVKLVKSCTQKSFDIPIQLGELTSALREVKKAELTLEGKERLREELEKAKPKLEALDKAQKDFLKS